MSKVDNLFENKNYSLVSILSFLYGNISSMYHIVLIALLLCGSTFFKTLQKQKLSTWSNNFQIASKYADFRIFMFIKVLGMAIQIISKRSMQKLKINMSRHFKAVIFYKCLHGQLEKFLDVIPAHEITKTLKQAAKVIVKITFHASDFVKYLMKLLIFFFYIKVALGWMNFFLVVLYCLIYFFFTRIQLKISSSISKFTDSYRSQNPDILGLALENLTEIRCMNLQSYINSKHQEVETTLEKASETIKMVRWSHRFYSKYMGRLLIEIPMYIGAFLNPSIINIVGLPTLMYYSKSIQSTLE